MIIKCSECSTKFVVSPEAIGPEGRMVRCAKCSHVWHADPAPDDHEIVPTEVIKKPEPVSEPEPDPKTETEPAADVISDKPDVAPVKDEMLNVEEDGNVDDPRDGPVDSPVPAKEKPADDGIPGEDLDGDGDGDGDDDFELHDPDEDEDTSGDNLPAVVKDRSKVIKVGWGLWAILMIGSLSTFVFAKDAVLNAWPAAAVIYNIVGMGDEQAPTKAEDKAENNTDKTAEIANKEEPKGPTREELERAVVITNTFKIESIGGGRRDLVIDGTLRSTVDYDVTLPPMKGVLKNSTDVNVHEWSFTPAEKILKAGASMNFRTVSPSIPADTAAYELFLLWPKDN